MPFKSQAQRRKFAQLLVEGKISNETFEEWNRETGRKKLPERVGTQARAARRAKSPRKPRAAKKRRWRSMTSGAGVGRRSGEVTNSDVRGRDSERRRCLEVALSFSVKPEVAQGQASNGIERERSGSGDRCVFSNVRSAILSARYGDDVRQRALGDLARRLH
jgi:hypothetical protein